jgi:hypothetical protein
MWQKTGEDAATAKKVVGGAATGAGDVLQEGSDGEQEEVLPKEKGTGGPDSKAGGHRGSNLLGMGRRTSNGSMTNPQGTYAHGQRLVDLWTSL